MVRLPRWLRRRRTVKHGPPIAGGAPATTFPTTLDTLDGLRYQASSPIQESTMLDNVVGAVLAIEAAYLTGAIVKGVGNAYRVARGVHQQAAATDTIVTGLTTVVAVVAQMRDAPTINILWYSATIGDQAGSPAAGSFNLSIFKPTATGNVTPLAATVFTDNINFNWIAIGT